MRTTHDVILAAIDAGADVIELGVPFSDPLADGPVIQRASERALKSGTSLRQVIDLGSEIRRQRPNTGLIIFSYLNPILSMGIDRFCTALSAAGIDGALVTDLTLEEADDYLWKMRQHGLATVFLAAPTSTEQRLKAIAKNSSGFIYAVSRSRRHWCAQRDEQRRQRLGEAASQAHAPSHCRRLWDIQFRTVRSRFQLRRRCCGRQCNRRDH